MAQTIQSKQTTRLSRSPASSATDVASIKPSLKSSPPRSRWEKVLNVVNWKPPNVRWNPEQPPVFSMGMNVLFGFAGAFTVANLYYSHPILNILAHEFGVSYETVSRIPTLAQAGYCVGLFFLNPLGDIFHRRPFVLCLVFFTATMWIGLCTTHNFAAFCAISFITAVTTVTPQLMLPLVGDLAPPERRAAALSIVAAGNLLGILIARLLSGIVAEYTSWRTVYWIAMGLQYLIFSLLWLFMPDYPSTNPAGINYFKILWSMILMLKKHPLLVQACLIAVASSAPFTSFWTTLTFLLAGDPYDYSPLIIGLFALIGIAGICVMPVFARIVVDRYVPLFSAILCQSVALIGICIGTYAGMHTIAGPVVQAFLIDMGLQGTQVANRSAIYAVEPKGRNRINTVFMVFTFFGQIIGTSAGNKLYARGGWIASGSLSVAMVVFGLAVSASRSPWEEGWVGWGGGWTIKKRERLSADGKVAETAMHLKSSGNTHVRVSTDEEAATGGAGEKTGETLNGNKNAKDESALNDEKRVTDKTVQVAR